MGITKSLFYFVIAGFCEIGGGYLVWLWRREGKSFSFAVLGAILLVLYGIVSALYELTEGIHARVSSSWTKRRGNVGAAVAPGSAGD